MNSISNLVELINELKNSPLKKIIDSRIREFEELGKKDSNEIFKELCFCIITANFSAHGGIKIQNKIGRGFSSLSPEELSKKLSELGHRFPNARAEFIVEARKYRNNLKEILNSFNDEKTAREWLVKNVKGLGFKEASHFLRNIGYKNVAIIDFHIIDLLAKHKIIEIPKTITPKKYLEIEEILSRIAKKTNINLGELDLYLWYLETGKILK